jgi:hypothetical protein
MREFDDFRSGLADRRRVLEEKRRNLLRAQEEASRASRDLESFKRRAGREDAAEIERREAVVESARTKAAELAAETRRLRVDDRRFVNEFGHLLDPRAQLPNLTDRVPILLFPLRLETRFNDVGDGKTQLWVRVYPDNCLVDSFDPLLTEAEVTNAQTFWAGIWRAGGDETMERAAWRGLVASHGSGRAGWIVSQYRPVNEGDKPVRDAATDILLIVIASAPVPAEVVAYWIAAWRAGGDLAAQQAALATLEGAVGAARAADIVKNRPFNFTDLPASPRTRANVQVKAAILQVTPASGLPTRQNSWSSAPRVDLIPDCLVLVRTDQTGNTITTLGKPIARPLHAGPDPNAPVDEQLKPDGDDLKIPDELRWMFDFQTAVDAGMGFVVDDLTASEVADGIVRLIVVGVRLGESPEEGRTSLDRLLEHHLHSRAGLEIVPQGTPTNNTEKKGAGFAFRDDSDATYATLFKGDPEYTEVADPFLRRDGQWLADVLGVSPALAKLIPNARGTDQSEGRSMQVALWPGTLGYMMRTLLSPIFPEDAIRDTRDFFIHHVSGRGPLPALRIGRQPYGIVLTTAFDRLDWFAGDPRINIAAPAGGSGSLANLYAILRRIQNDWQPLVDQVSRIGQSGGDPHQVLLDVLGLHPTSVEFYPLNAESVEHKFYELAFFDISIALEFLNLMQAIIPLSLLRSFGYTGNDIPDLLTKVWKARQTPLTGPLIDDRPLSETEPIRPYAGNRNYIQWLADAARTGLESIRAEQGFDANTKPTALLYLLLRHALQLGYREVALRLTLAADVALDVRPLVREPAFVHVREGQVPSESHYELLYAQNERITGNRNVTLADHIARNIRVIAPEFREQIEAVDRLGSLPTARLERIFAETIDTSSYRLDAWKTGLLGWQLERLRKEGAAGAEDGATATGLYLGAFGWVENLRIEGKELTKAEIDDDLRDRINGSTPPDSELMHDSTNAGLVHAPSLNHAATAAVLRNAYVANDGRLAVDLSSRRVRLALEIIDGMRNGQSLGALLGYQFERHVHDHGPLAVRALIYPLRKKFPLAANQIERTATDDGTREALAAQNVVDGRKLVEHVERLSAFDYPFGLAELPNPAPTLGHASALTAAVRHIRDINDAVADLVLAEGVHQAVIGNYERAAGTLDAFAKGSHPTEPEVIRTPRSGIALTLRTAIHLPVPPPAIPVPAIPTATPLALAEPSLNAWLAGRLPPPDDVRCIVSFTPVGSNAQTSVVFSQTQLGLHPIDLVYLTETSPDQALGDLEDRLLRRLFASQSPRHDREITIAYTERDGDNITFFELSALLVSLRSLVIASRSIVAADISRTNDASTESAGSISLARNRIADRLTELRDPAGGVLKGLADTTATLSSVATIDVALAAYANAVGRAAAYRLPQTSMGFVFEWRQGVYRAIADKIAGRVRTWDERISRLTALLVDYDAIASGLTEEDRIARLRAAEAVVSTAPTSPAPASGPYRIALDGLKSAFETKRGDLDELATVGRATLAGYVTEVQAAIGLAAFDPEPLEIDPETDEIDRFRASLLAAVGRLVEDIEARLTKVDGLLVEHDATSGSDRVRLLQDAGKVLFGEDVTLLPQLTLTSDSADELANAVTYSLDGHLTSHLAARAFPVDDWLHSVARVREKMHHWESAMVLGEALGATGSLEPTPIQLPHVAGEKWFGLEFEAGANIASERLLYTASLEQPFDASQPISGLIVDEWTEVIPAKSEETGVAFHYDRPNSEPPQAWLLALAAVRNGAWRWDELVDAVTDALDSAKRRAIEPVHVDGTPYSWFLPATMSSYTFPEISISNNLLANIAAYELNVKGE